MQEIQQQNLSQITQLPGTQECRECHPHTQPIELARALYRVFQ